MLLQQGNFFGKTALNTILEGRLEINHSYLHHVNNVNCLLGIIENIQPIILDLFLSINPKRKDLVLLMKRKRKGETDFFRTL